MSITILGLGPGDPGLLTRAAWDQIQHAQVLYLRTAIHPTVASLPSGLRIYSFDQRYEHAPDFSAVYDAIADELLDRAQAGEEIVYAVPGDPLMAEATTRRILALGRARGLTVRVISGVSFIEPVCAALGIDPLEGGLQLLDALDLVPAHANAQDSSAPPETWASLHGYDYDPPLAPFPLLPTRPALICQVYSRRIASDVKLSLMERYPAAHPLLVVRAAGVAGEERVIAAPLHELDHQESLNHLTCVFVPALAPLADQRGPDGLSYIVSRLLGPGGCPWDREQTPRSLRSALLSEAHEVLEALDADDPAGLAEELGDLLMNILAQAEMARQAGDFGPGDIYAAVSTKLIRRHPHVFGPDDGGFRAHGAPVALDVSNQPAGQAISSAEVLRNWEAIKQAERAEAGRQTRGTLDGIPPGLPALAVAQELARKAARTGFEWPDSEGAWRKVTEEIAEVHAIAVDPPADMHERAVRLENELGDLLLATAVVARALEVDAESALRGANARFRARFGAMERIAANRGIEFRALSLAEKLGIWEEAKRMTDDERQ